MSQLVSINLNPDQKTLRQFGFIALGAFSLCAFSVFRAHGITAALGELREEVALVFIALAAVCLLFSLVFPRGNWPIYVGLSLITYPLGVVVSYVILGALFAFVIGPIAIVFRLVGRDVLARRASARRESYWVARKRSTDSQRYFRQF
ncbi:MAG: SxtJ family membrane protein [Myxococcota bacterium]